MTIEQLGSLGEFLGFLAVLVTLGYLAIQTRQTAHAARQRSHSDILARRIDLYRVQYEDPEVLGVLSKAFAQERLDAMEAQAFTVWILSFMSHLQDTYIQFKSGLIDEDVWEAELKLGTAAFTQPGFLSWWEHGKQFLTDEFVTIIEAAQTVNLVAYDPESNSWGRPEGGLLGKDAVDAE